MEVIRVIESDMAQAVEKAARVLNSGGVVAYPTDTAYGLAANGLDVHAIEKIFLLKKRPINNPIHLVLKNVDAVSKIAELNTQQRVVLEYWLPGAVTFILKRKPIVPASLVAGRETVGVRIPDHPLTRILSKQVRFPYTATSANVAGSPSIYHIGDLKRDFADSSLLALDCGELTPGLISTVVDISEWPKHEIIREGVISAEQFDRFFQNFS